MSSYPGKPPFKGTGINTAVHHNIIQNAWDMWQLQREQDSHAMDHGGGAVQNLNVGPVCTIIKKVKTNGLAPYLDNGIQEITVTNIPVLSKPVRYRNQYGKVVIDSNSIYLIFLGDVADPQNPTFGPEFAFITKNDIIDFEGMRWSIDEIDHEPSSMLTQVELLLVGGSTDNGQFLGRV